MTAQWDAEVVIDEALVIRLFGARFPQLLNESRRYIGEGWDCVAWLVSETWAFRFPRRQLGADCLDNEIRVLPGVTARLATPVSCSVMIGQPTDFYPWTFAACPLIPGLSVCDAGLSDEQRIGIAGQLGEFLRTLHAVDAAEATSLGAEPDTIRRLDVAKRCGRARQAITQARHDGLIENGDELRREINVIEESQPQARTHCLVHGDLYSRHVMTESCELTGIIDWGDVHVGDPAVDLAVGWSMFAADARRAFFDSYGSVDTTTRNLALMRAVGHGLACLQYAHDVSDENLLVESQQALHRVVAE